MKDALIVLAGGVRADGSLPTIPQKRVETGVRLLEEGVAPYIIMSGRYGFRLDHIQQVPPVSEAEAMGKFAISLGVPSERILLELSSKDTLGNAFFTKTLFLEPRGWKKVTVVTSDFHLPRTKYLFDLVLGPEYETDYISTPTEGAPESTAEFEKWEGKSLKVFTQFFEDGAIKPGDTEAIKKLIFTKHPGYAEHPEISYETLMQMFEEA